MAAQKFRIGVVIVVKSSTGDLLVFERGDIPDQWQFPQGGVDVDEEPAEAAWRELVEETGLTAAHVTLSGEYPDWVLYEYPVELRGLKGQRGQAHRWFFFDALDDGIQPTPDNDEFVAWKWAPRNWVLDNVVEFRRASYTQVLTSQ